ncbi:S41 family peptidase [Candidatus Curtissbacteria bacterium]|nr:S41 family peptidase [Candidatus Curtissbacteria bacterium]
MQRIPKIQIILVILISLLVGYYFGVNKINFDWKNYRPKITVESKKPPAQVSNVDFSVFWTVWQKLENSYYDKTKLDPQKMINGAISGMVQSLDDPFTVYLPPVQNDNFKQGLAGQFQGIGAELGIKDQKILVISPLNGSPAQKAGIRAGDFILAVNGGSTANMTLSQAVEKIRGPKGTTVTLTIIHKDENSPKDIKIVRDVITVKSVETWIKKGKDIDAINLDKKYHESKVAYIRLSQFGDNTNSEWLASINDLNLKLGKDKDVSGVILDLRNNPGGYLSDAVFISSEFLREGVEVVSEEEASGKTVLKANRRGFLTETPVIVLINKGSASASEIVAGALRDNDRAKLVGETSFGKGTIQQAEDLGGGAGIHVTVAKWLTPNGTWVNGEGLKPDLEVALDSKNPERDTQLEKAVQELVK